MRIILLHFSVRPDRLIVIEIKHDNHDGEDKISKIRNIELNNTYLYYFHIVIKFIKSINTIDEPLKHPENKD